MASVLKITTPETQPFDGLARLSAFQMNGKTSRKIFTVENTAVGVENVDFFLVQGGTGEAFTLAPGGLTCSIIFIDQQKISFAVDYDASKGSGVTASLFASQAIETDNAINYVMIGPSTSIDFTVLNPEENTRREIGPLLIQDEDSNYLIQQSGRKVTQDETSFGILRTNPKLTGNVKITVDSDQNIWLNSIDAEKELADDRFKKFRLSPDSSFAIDIKRFFDYGQTPKEIVFSLYQADTQYTSTKRTYAEQYDRFYQYGITQLKSRFYPEDFSFFAPLYMKEELPEYFVIFRTNGPLNNFSYDLPFSQWPQEVSAEILSNSQVIKTYSLKEDSQIGRYLRNIINHPSRKPTDLTVSYQKNGYTTFNGVVYTQGSFGQMGELLYDYINQENPLISVEEFITLGFQRNNVISSHVMNLEFLFDDPTAESYSINRYFGLYVNSVDLAKFTMNGTALQQYSLSVGQLPLPRRGVDGNKVSLKSFTQTNSTGIRVYADTSSVIRVPELDPVKVFSSVVNTINLGATSSEIVLLGDYRNKLENGELISFYNASGFTASVTLSSFIYDDNRTLLTFENSTYNSIVSLGNFDTFEKSWKVNFFTEEKYKAYRDSVFDNIFIEDAPRLYYVKDNDSNFHSVASTRVVTAEPDPFTSEKVIEIKLKDTTFDMANLGGFTNLLTQTESLLLDSKGKASIEIEILNYFSPNDYLEVRWEPGPSIGGFPLRWKVVANETATQPGQTWPAYSVEVDNEGEYYLAYFNPGNSTVTVEDFATSVVSAFLRFPYRNFEVTSIGRKIYFRSTQEGRSSQSTRLFFFNEELQKMRVMGIDAPNQGDVYFMGGSDRRRTRARISSSVARGMLKDEYVSTKGNFSLPQSYDVFGNTIVFSPYLEEPIYDEVGERLIGFTGSDRYSVITLKDESYEIQQTFDKQMTTYQLFQPSFGLFSVLPLRDFDTDFYSSEYARSYTPELIEYFSRYTSPLTVVTVAAGATSDTYTFDKEVTFDTYPQYVPYLLLSENGEDPALPFNTERQFLYTSGGLTATFVKRTGLVGPAAGSKILLMPGEKIQYFNEDELSKFKGFLSLSPLVSATDEAEFQALENLWDPARFVVQSLGSEYDRLGENFLKTLVLKSRVVPYVTKWVVPQGKDIRDNPYRFNYHRVFGNMSFSPSETMQNPDPRFHTHEWSYLDQVPYKFPIKDYPEFTFSYFFNPLDGYYDFSSLAKDWFSEYFSTGYPTELYLDENGNFVPALVDPSEKYSFFNFETFTEKTFTLFRGYRLQISEIDKDTQALVSGSQKYNNYRFSCIMKLVEDDPYVNEDPIEFRTIVNEKWKFIVLQITLKTSTYRFPKGNLRYVDLYTLENKNSIATYKYDPSETLDGLEQYFSTAPDDAQLSVPIDLGLSTTDTSLGPEFYDASYDSESFVDDYTEEVVILEDGNFSDMTSFYKVGTVSYGGNFLRVKSVYDRNTIQLGSNFYFKLNSTPTVLQLSLPYTSFNWTNFIFFHEGGGNNSLVGLNERLTFSEVSKVINGNSERARMNFTIYREDGTVDINADFILSTVSPEQLTRIFDYYPVSDTDKPPAFFTYDQVGVVLSEQKDLQSLYRYQGDFSPKFTDVLKFWLRESNDLTTSTSQDMLFLNTHFAPELGDFSLLKNQFYTKVADTEILTIAPESGYLPVYPLVNEVAIDKKNLFAWSSSWDQNYYRKYNSTSDFVEVRGTEEMKELKSFLGSKAMKVPKQFDLFLFGASEAASGVSLDSLISNEFVYREENGTAVLQVNVYNRLIREMLGTVTDLRARKEFKEVAEQVQASFSGLDISVKAEEYLRKNVMELYQIKEVRIFVLRTGDPGENSIATVPSTAAERPLVQTNNGFTFSEAEYISKGYSQQKDAKVINLENLIFRVNYPLDSRFYTSLGIGVVVERI
jgi:hypothetical protein